LAQVIRDVAEGRRSLGEAWQPVRKNSMRVTEGANGFIKVETIPPKGPPWFIYHEYLCLPESVDPRRADGQGKVTAGAPPHAPVSETSAPRTSGDESAVIRYTPGQPIMVDVLINNSASARLLLDTGADRTLISPLALGMAGVPPTKSIGRGQMAGVTGTDSVNYVIVDSLRVGAAKVTNIRVAVYEMPQASGDGLLGRDFLDRFTVNIDSRRGLVTLTSPPRCRSDGRCRFAERRRG